MRARLWIFMRWWRWRSALNLARVLAQHRPDWRGHHARPRGGAPPPPCARSSISLDAGWRRGRWPPLPTSSRRFAGPPTPRPCRSAGRARACGGARAVLAPEPELLAVANTAGRRSLAGAPGPRRCSTTCGQAAARAGRHRRRAAPTFAPFEGAIVPFAAARVPAPTQRVVVGTPLSTIAWPRS